MVFCEILAVLSFLHGDSEILKSQLATRFTVYKDYTADFSEFLPMVCYSCEEEMGMKKFSQASSLLNLSCKVIQSSTFEKWYL